MRVWLDPDRLASRQLTATDVVRAIREQNVQVAAGVLGAPPAPTDTTFQLSINAQGRLNTEEQFGDIVVRATPDGQITRLRDVGRVELGASTYSLRSLLDNQPAVGDRHLPAARLQRARGVDAGPRDDGAAEGVVSRRPGLPHRLRPDGLRARVDQAVVETLFDAILLVVIVVVVFLQTWRASIIPLVAVPVSLVGTFAVMLVLGFSLNTLSLFGLVLAIGIVVDDAIVVVENVERHIALGQTPIEATRQGDGRSVGPDHRDRAGAVRGVRADRVHQRPDRPVLPAVRADHRDLDGDLGVQLADAEPGAGVAAAAAARRAATIGVQRGVDALFGWFFRLFNRFFTGRRSAYAGGVARVLRVARRRARRSTSG